MSKFHIALKGLVFSLMFQSLYAEERLVALTIDDLPFVGPVHNKNGQTNRFYQLVSQIEEKQVPATGFIIAGSIEKGQEELLDYFKQKGYSLGNHTYTHISLNSVGAKRYIEDLDKSEERLQGILTVPKYFRYPYLAEGRGSDKLLVQEYLANHNYVIAPVTIDSKDYKFNGRLLAVNWRNRDDKLASIKKDYLAYIDKQITAAEKIHKPDTPEILLVHANLLNSHAMGEVIELFKSRGYRFISLDEAIRIQNEQTMAKEMERKQVLITNQQ
jgi:peptidoglycan/xylan/chitin deacetylase (PgdA/CDA1 family)